MIERLNDKMQTNNFYFMKTSFYVTIMIAAFLFTSCGSFGEGLLMGMSGLGYGGYGASASSSYSGGVNALPDTRHAVSGNSSYSAPTSNYGSNSSSASRTSKTCSRTSASDIAHCGGSGVCSKCNGKGKYYDTSFGNARWVDPCVTCRGSGKCPTCRGTGKI